MDLTWFYPPTFMHGTSHSHQLTKLCLAFDSSCLWDWLTMSIVKQHTFFLVVLRRPRSFEVLASCWVQWMSSLWLSAIEAWKGKQSLWFTLVSDPISGWANSHDFTFGWTEYNFREVHINTFWLRCSLIRLLHLYLGLSTVCRASHDQLFKELMIF